MKKIEALKNNETGELEQPQRMLANKGKAGEALYFYRLTQYPQKDYTPTPCLLIEEHDLHKKLLEFGYTSQGYEKIGKWLFNSLTEIDMKDKLEEQPQTKKGTTLKGWGTSN